MLVMRIVMDDNTINHIVHVTMHVHMVTTDVIVIIITAAVHGMLVLVLMHVLLVLVMLVVLVMVVIVMVVMVDMHRVDRSECRTRQCLAVEAE